MRKTILDLPIFLVGAKPSAAFTAATTDIITSNAHGLSEGDCVTVSSTTTLPAGLSASTNYYVRDVTTNTFKVSATKGGAVVDITDAGTGTHTYLLRGKKILVQDFNNVLLSMGTASSAAFVIKFQGSTQENVDFNAAASSTNRWDYIQVKDYQNNAAIDGNTGITYSGTDANRVLEFNISGLTCVTAIISSYTAGNINLLASLYANE